MPAPETALFCYVLAHLPKAICTMDRDRCEGWSIPLRRAGEAGGSDQMAGE